MFHWISKDWSAGEHQRLHPVWKRVHIFQHISVWTKAADVDRWRTDIAIPTVKKLTWLKWDKYIKVRIQFSVNLLNQCANMLINVQKQFLDQSCYFLAFLAFSIRILIHIWSPLPSFTVWSELWAWYVALDRTAYWTHRYNQSQQWNMWHFKSGLEILLCN